MHQVDDLLVELLAIQAAYKARSKDIEPLADRAVALIGGRFSEQAAAIKDAKNSPSLSDLAGVVETQLQIVRDQFSQEGK